MIVPPLLLLLLHPVVAIRTPFAPITRYWGVYSVPVTRISDSPRASTTTHQNVVSLTATSMPPNVTPFSTSTSVTMVPGIGSLTYIENYIRLNEFPEPWPTSNYDLHTNSHYYEMVVKTAPAYCTGPFATTWTHTETTSIHNTFVSDVGYQLSPIITSTGTITHPMGPGPSHELHFVLPAGEWVQPTPTIEIEPTDQSAKSRACSSPVSTPTEFPPTDPIAEYVGRNDGDRELSSFDATYTIAILCGVFGSLFFTGLIEHYVWFQRLMRGEKSLRLGTCCWTVMTLGIGFILIRRQDLRPNAEHRKILRERWNSTGSRTRAKLWFKWGFTWRYPAELLRVTIDDVGPEADTDEPLPRYSLTSFRGNPAPDYVRPTGLTVNPPEAIHLRPLSSERTPEPQPAASGLDAQAEAGTPQQQQQPPGHPQTPRTSTQPPPYAV